jgi:hypothetical protein
MDGFRYQLPMGDAVTDDIGRESMAFLSIHVDIADSL